MKCRVLSQIFILIGLILIAGCSHPPAGSSPATVLPPPVSTPCVTVPAARTPLTTADLIPFVDQAVAYARANGREKAIAVFNDPKGPFVKGNLYIFAEDYDGTALAEPLQHQLVGTNIRNMTDPYGVPIVRNLGETARFGKGYVSYDYENPGRNGTVEHKLSVVEDVDGTYYVGAGLYSDMGQVYPSVVLNPSGRELSTGDLVTYVKSAVAFAKANGKEKAIAVLNDPTGQFVQGQLVIFALDDNGTVLANPPYSPELAVNRINLINYHDPDGVGTIREMRDRARSGGGFSYTVAKVTVNGTDYYVPKIDYAEPVDGTWWLFSGIIVPEYYPLATGNITGVPLRNHTRAELYELVDRAVAFARANGKEKILAEINDPEGRFSGGDLFAWAESFDGTLLADPYWKAGVGKNFITYTDPYGAMTTVTGIDAIRNGTGFSHAMFPDTAANGTASIPKLVYMKAVDDMYWIGSGLYGVEVGPGIR